MEPQAKDEKKMAKWIAHIRETGSFYIPKGGVISDVALAAYLGQNRIANVIDTFFFCTDPQQTPVKSVRVGNRRICTTDELWEFCERNAEAAKRMRRGGRGA